MHRHPDWHGKGHHRSFFVIFQLDLRVRGCKHRGFALMLDRWCRDGRHGQALA